jgi:transcriptional regulator with XRE-family HTH domain
MLGQILKETRLAAGLTQEELAHAAGVDRSYISQLERDLKSPTIQMLFRLCGALGASPTKVIAQLERSGGG